MAGRAPRGWIGTAGRAARAVPRVFRHPLAILLAFASLQLLTWSLVTPAFQGPDEDSHFAYTQRLVERHRLPPPTAGGSPLSTEFIVASAWADLEPTRGILEARPGWSAAEQEHWQAAAKSLQAAQRADGAGANAAGENPPLYYAYESVPYWLGLHTSKASFFTRVELMRLANLPWYLATIVFVWLLVCEVMGRPWEAAIAASLVTLEPEFGFLSATINPDVALAAEWSGFIYFGIRIVKSGPAVARTSAFVLLAVGALFTQARSLALAPISIAILLLAPKVSKRAYASAAIAGSAICGAAYASLAFARAHALPGSVAISAPPFHVTQFLSYLWQFYLPRLPGMAPMIGPDYGASDAWVVRFFGNLGWLEIEFPAWVNTALRAATLLLIVALATGLLLRWKAVRRSWRIAVALAGCLLGELLVLHVVAYESLVANGDPVLTGRYLFPLIGIWGLAVSASLSLLPRPVRAPAATAIVVSAALLDLLAFTLATARFYA